MMNRVFNLFNNIIKIEVTGKNINNFLKRIIANDIAILSLNYINHNKVNIIIKASDYNKIDKIKTIYQLKIIKYYGRLHLLRNIKKNIHLLSFLFIGILFIIFLSNIIFDIEILHTNKEIIRIVSNELDNYNLKKYSFKKDYEEIEKIEKKILENNKDKIEWIEIDTVGTKYIVNVEQRKIKKKNDNNIYQDIVASKNAIIYSIDAEKGEKVKKNLQYVYKDEVIISGTLNKTNGEVIYLKALGNVLGEVWYTVDIEYPFTYKEELLTGKVKKIYALNFLNKSYSFFNYKKYNTFNSKKKILFKSNLIPLSFVKENQYELKVINEIYTEEEVINKAIELSKKKMLEQNKMIKEFKNIEILAKENMASKIKLKLFISVIEDITKTSKIDISVKNN